MVGGTHNDSDAPTELLDPLVRRARSRVGQVLREKWRLDVLLGVGGMAAVYAGTHRNGSRGAIKILHTELSVNAQVRTRFAREGLVANAVGHEGAVRVIDDDVAEDGSLFMVTELLDGETLEARRERFGGKLPEDEVLCAADQLLDVLAAAHDKGIWHRDTKPENLFLTRSGQLKVLDFGIARLRELSTVSTATREGASMGTPAYMPPEQARGLWDEVDARSDIWAVGATLFHLLTGRTVHGGRTTNEQLIIAATQTAPGLVTVDPQASPTVAHLVDRALAFEREHRWPSALRMQEAVRHAYHDRHGAPLSTAPRLTVPETVPDRTLPGATPVLAGGATTGQPVARSGTERPPRSPALVVGLMVGGAVALGAAGAAWVVLGRASPMAPSTGSEATPAVREPPPAVASAPPPASPDPPAMAATDPPVAAPVRTAAPPPVLAPVPTAKPTVAPAASVAAPTAPPPKPLNCAPPYTIDEVGKKHFKPECL